MANLGHVAIKPKGEWVIGVVYKPLNAVMHNGNLYLALQENAVEPTDDGVNWWLILEGVKIATVEEAGKSKPDGKTITIDPDGTLHGASQVPEGVTYVDLQGGGSGQLPDRIPVDADTLDGHLPEYFATKKEVSELDLTQWNYVVPNMQQITFKQNDSSDVKLGFDSDGNWNIYYGTNKLLEINDLADIVTMPYRLDVEDMLNVSMDARIDGYLTVGRTSTFKGDVYYPANVGLFFGAAGTNHYLLYSTSDHDLYLNRKVGSIVSTIFSVDADDNKTYFRSALQVALCSNDSDTSVGGIEFFAGEGNVHKIVESQNTGNLIFCNNKKGAENKFIESAHISLNGDWVFKKNISAPNLASATAELLSAQQDITEADLQNIELQQRVAQLEEKVQELSGGDSGGKTDY